MLSEPPQRQGDSGAWPVIPTTPHSVVSEANDTNAARAATLQGMTTTLDPHAAFNSALDGLQAAAGQTATAAVNANMAADDHSASASPNSRPIAGLLSPPPDFGIPESNLTWDFGDFLGPKSASQRVHEVDVISGAVKCFSRLLDDVEREEGSWRALTRYGPIGTARLFIDKHDLTEVLNRHMLGG